jgi:hypothetical protein
MSKVAILFLAHDGVISLPETWNRWRGKFKEQVVFYALSPQPFEGFKSLKAPTETSWCSPSLVHAYLNGLRQILEDDVKKEIAIIYFVSGKDAPVRPIEFLLSLPLQTKICRAGSTTLHLPDGKTQTVDLMHQWFAVTRTDAERLVGVKPSRFLPLMSLYQASMEKPTLEHFETSNNQWLANLEKLQARYKKEEKEKKAYLNTLEFYHSLVSDRLKRKVLDIPLICPDEYWILALMKELKIEPRDDCTTGFFKPIKDKEQFGPIPSPITWRSPKDVYALNTNDPNSKSVSFEDALRYNLKRRPNMVFFRKLDPVFPQDYSLWTLEK